MSGKPKLRDHQQEGKATSLALNASANRQLAHLDFAVVQTKADAGLALTLRELAVRTGFGYSKVRTWVSNGLPLFEGKIFWTDFIEWKASKIGNMLGTRAISSKPHNTTEIATVKTNRVSKSQTKVRGRHLDDIFR